MSDTLVINEIYLSLQGESTFAGLPCIFIRLTACDLRCSYCDTAYAFTEGKKKHSQKLAPKSGNWPNRFPEGRALRVPKIRGSWNLPLRTVSCRWSNLRAANRCSKKIPCR